MVEFVAPVPKKYMGSTETALLIETFRAQFSELDVNGNGAVVSVSFLSTFNAANNACVLTQLRAMQDSREIVKLTKKKIEKNCNGC